MANASRSWFLALKLPVLLDPLARRIACPDLAEPTKTPYVTFSNFGAGHHRKFLRGHGAGRGGVSVTHKAVQSNIILDAD